MSEKRKCVNCRHRILNEETVSSKCEIDGHRIDYAECFEGWCRHWAIDEIHTNQGGFFKLPNGLYAHYSCGNPKTEKELSKKLGKAKLRKTPLSNGKSCTEFLKWWERIKDIK